MCVCVSMRICMCLFHCCVTACLSVCSFRFVIPLFGGESVSVFLWFLGCLGVFAVVFVCMAVCLPVCLPLLYSFFYTAKRPCVCMSAEPLRRSDPPGLYAPAASPLSLSLSTAICLQDGSSVVCQLAGLIQTKFPHGLECHMSWNFRMSWMAAGYSLKKHQLLSTVLLALQRRRRRRVRRLNHSCLVCC